MSYNPNAGGSVSDGSVTSAKLGGDITTAGKNVLTAADKAAQKVWLATAIADVSGLQTALDGKVSSSALGWTTVHQASDATVNNSTTFQNSSLTFSVAANTKYRFSGLAFIDTGATADAKFQFTGPASPTVLRIQTKSINAAATAYGNIRVETAFSQSRALAGTGTNGVYVEFTGILHNGANAGSVMFQWGANALEVVNTILRAGSYIEYAVVA